jgi:hypothetical protein
MYKPDFAKLTCPLGLSFAKSRYVPLTKDGRQVLPSMYRLLWLFVSGTWINVIYQSIRTLKFSYINIEVPEASWNEKVETYNQYIKLKTPWPESASELYLPSDRRLSAKLVATFADRGCHIVSVTDPYGRNLSFIYRKIKTYYIHFTNLTEFSGIEYPKSIMQTCDSFSTTKHVRTCRATTSSPLHIEIMRCRMTGSPKGGISFEALMYLFEVLFWC